MKCKYLPAIILITLFNSFNSMATSQTKPFDKEFINEILKIRNELHNSPEYSHKEENTAKIILKHLQPTNPEFLFTNIGGLGIIAGYKGNLEGPSVMFRCEMDAIKTERGFEHLCGHDGHMAILLGLSQIVSRDRNFGGAVYLLFQPAEEIGEGAADMMKDMQKRGISFDYSFALHNNPKYPLNTIAIHPGVYAAGSVGMEIGFRGEPSHAAYPNQAISPYNAMIETVSYMQSLIEREDVFKGFVLGTVVNVSLGEINYGVTPGEGFVRMTLRSFIDEDLDKLCKMMKDFAEERAAKYGLKAGFAYFDRFPATINDTKANDLIERAASIENIKICYADEPNRGSDDFAFFAASSVSSYFNIGNGNENAGVHTTGYKFSEEIIETALRLYRTLLYDVKTPRIN